jgi:hypothetical protein
LNVSEDRIEATSAESSGHSVDAGNAVADATPASAPADVEAPALAPEQGAAAKAATDAPTSNPTEPRPGSRTVTIMTPARRDSWDDKSWKDDDFTADRGPETSTAKSSLFGKRRLGAIAAVIVLSAVAGAVGGALATAGLSHLGADNGASIQAKVLDEQVTRLESEVAALKTNVEHNAKLSVAQVSKTADRLDRIEKAQAEPAAKIAKLTETVDKLRAAPAPAPVAAAAAPAPKDVTASIPAPAVQAPTPAAPPKPEVARLPTVEGWVLRDVADGAAVIQGRGGIYEVYAGDPVPGLGRVDAIRRQDGRWVVVTSRGLIVAR